MGNSIGGRRKGAKIMQLDGTAFRVKPPAYAGTVLREHPGFQLLDSEQVKLLGVRARPLEHDATLRPGRLYFLVALPKPTAPPRRAWSGALHVGARERLESLMLTRRSTSDLSFPTGTAPASPAASEGGPVQLRMRLPKAQLAKLMGESRDPAEAAAKIMQLCAANAAARAGSGAATPERFLAPRTPERGAMFVPTPDWGTGVGLPQTPERSPRFVPTPDWGAGRFSQTPERDVPRFAATPEWGARFMMPTPERDAAGMAKTPDRWASLARTPDAKASRKEKRTRFVALPDEIIALPESDKTRPLHPSKLANIVGPDEFGDHLATTAIAHDGPYLSRQGHHGWSNAPLCGSGVGFSDAVHCQNRDIQRLL